MQKNAYESIGRTMLVRKTFLIMKISVFLLLIALQVSATNFAQYRVNLKATNVTVLEVLKNIEKQSSYRFSYSNDVIPEQKLVSIHVVNADINDVLRKVFEGYALHWKVLKRRNVIITGETEMMLTQPSDIIETITGSVLNDKGESIAGASVLVKNSTIGTTTDADGNFSINANKGDVLVISAIGYTTQEIPVRDQEMIVVALVAQSGSLQEVVVVGYGTQRRLNLTGSVSSVSGEEMTKRPVTNPATMLQGQMPGIRIVQGTGQPGVENVQIRVRGQGTYSSAGSDPLVLIDGVPGSLSTMNPNDIESVSVLKDAASASIYGARAANGVVLVTTKTGREGRFSIDYSANFAQHTPTKMLKLVTNSAEYMRLFNEARKNSGTASATNTYTDDMISLYENATDRVKYPNFDWLGYMFNPASVQMHNLSLNGGVSGTSYNVSLGYVNQPGTMRGFDFEKYNIRTNLKSKINSWATIGANIALERGQTRNPRQSQDDAFLSTLAQAPTYAPLLPDGRATFSAYNFEAHNKNMAAIVANEVFAKSINYDVSSQVWTDFILAKGLNWYSKAAFTLADVSTKDWRPVVPVYNYLTGAPAGSLDVGGKGLISSNNRNFYSNVFSYLKYKFNLSIDHDLSLQAGYSQEKNNYQTLSGYRQDYVSNILQEINAGGAAVQTAGGTTMEWALQSVFGRLNYAYLNRYLFEANLRYDGTSRIASESRWGMFPSFSAGWRFSDEPFLQNKISWLTDGKLRASYGLLGNQNVNITINNISYPYPYQDILTLTGAYSYDNANLSPGVAQTALSNRKLKWEATAMTDIGVDLQFFGNRLSITYDWYKKHTYDILRGAQVTAIVGLSAPTINSGDMENTGHELMVQYNDRVRAGSLEGLQYGGGFYLDIVRNKLVKFGSREISGYVLRENGLPYNSFYMLDMIGIFQTPEEIASSPKQFSDNVQPGDFKYRDVNNDNKIDNDDRIVIPGRFPKFNYSFNGNLGWKGFDLSFLFQGEEGRRIYTDGWGLEPFRQGTPPTVDYANNRWTGPGSTNAYPRLYFDYDGNSQNRRSNSWYLQYASYLRLKNLTFGYNLPEKLLSRTFIKRARVFFAGDNLATFTKYKGLDPERAGDGRFAQYPQNKILSLGINVGL